VAVHQAEKKMVDQNFSFNNQQYTGHPAPGKWTQSDTQWSPNYQSFIGALRDIYTFKTFLEWFRIHKDKCDKIMRCKGFCVGFCYNLVVRANTFQCDMIRGKMLVFADVSKYWEEIAYKMLAEAQGNNKIGHINNPYTARKLTSDGYIRFYIGSGHPRQTRCWTNRCNPSTDSKLVEES
jgi:hypothetical protein